MPFAPYDAADLATQLVAAALEVAAPDQDARGDPIYRHAILRRLVHDAAAAPEAVDVLRKLSILAALTLDAVARYDRTDRAKLLRQLHAALQAADQPPGRDPDL